MNEALTIAQGEREGLYGTPESSLDKIAEMWSAYLGIPLDGHDAAIMMVLFKVARVCTGVYVKDNYTDIAGYAACAAELKALSEGK